MYICVYMLDYFGALGGRFSIFTADTCIHDIYNNNMCIGGKVLVGKQAVWKRTH